VTKGELRSGARVRLAALPPEARAAESAAAAARVWTLPEVASARALLLYAALPAEVDTAPIRDEARARGVAVLYPLPLGGGRMTLHRLDDDAALRPGRYGIPEPDPARAPEVDPGDVDAAILPGLAWDRQRSRLGRGAGYYDRLLAHASWRGFRCGLFFTVQEVPRIPADPWDVPLDAVVTAREVVR
jgi:5-formyltetrahydrofolate cyclo-ligase